MTRKLKTLGLASVAVAAMSMATASLTQAAQLHATSNQNIVVTGHQHAGENVFQLTTSLAEDKGPKVKCAQATFEGTAQTQGGSQVTGDELTATPILSGCTAFGQNATVKLNGCHFAATGAGQPAKTMVLDGVCTTAGKQIEIQTAICQVKIPAQTTGGHVTLANVAGSPHSVTAQITVNSLKHEYSAGIGCGHAKGVQTTDGDYEGFVNFQAYKDLGISHQVQRPTTNPDGHLYKEYTHEKVALGIEAT